MPLIKRALLSVSAAFVLAAAGFTHADVGMSSGTIKNIDAAAGKVTIKHGPIDNLEMPPMTMVFGVTDRAILESFAAGDEIEFVAKDENGSLVVAQMVAAH